MIRLVARAVPSLAPSPGFVPAGFGRILLLSHEIRITTPPFGVFPFVTSALPPPGPQMRDIYVAAFPYMGCVLLLVFF
ncbi:MAG: hypothetical protein QNK42_01610 [Pseudodonghicola sp.]|nr:hypothetical protein [Pseudodonghicola sp.]